MPSTSRTTEPRIPDEVSAWLEQELGEAVQRIQVMHTHLRSYSEIQVLTVQTARRTRKLVCKRSVHQASNEIYRHRGNAAKIEFDALRRVFARMQSDRECRVPRPRFVRPELGLLVMDFVAGESLECSLPAARITSSSSMLRRAAGSFQRVGRWLRRFQSKLDLEYVDAGVMDHTLAHCDDRLKMIRDCEHAAVPNSFRADVMTELEQLRRSIQGLVPVSDCHGDFGPWNVLLNGQKVAVIDFFAHRRDCVLTDAMEMLVYLESQQYCPSFSTRRIQWLQDAFCEGFDCRLELDAALLRLCEAHHRIRRIHDCLMNATNTWRERYRAGRVLQDNLQWFRQRQPARFHCRPREKAL